MESHFLLSFCFSDMGDLKGGDVILYYTRTLLFDYMH